MTQKLREIVQVPFDDKMFHLYIACLQQAAAVATGDLMTALVSGRIVNAAMRDMGPDRFNEHVDTINKLHAAVCPEVGEDDDDDDERL